MRLRQPARRRRGDCGVASVAWADLPSPQGAGAQTHIFLCVLAYHLLVAIEKPLRDGGLYTYNCWSNKKAYHYTNSTDGINNFTDHCMLNNNAIFVCQR
jgi:hypothetical protein